MFLNMSKISNFFKRYINFYKYTWSIIFIFRILIAQFFVKIGDISWRDSKFWVKMLKVANYFCSKEYIFNTPFWKYLSWSLQEYVLMDDNYEPEIWKLIKKLSDKKWEKYLINIWCNVWRWAIDLAKNFNYNVIAFEPAPIIYNSLLTNVTLSWLLEKFELYNIALWNENTNLNFEYRKFHNGSSHIIDNNGDAKVVGWEIIKVPVKKFDDLWILKEKIEKTRLIIMDVEWFELNVLKWMESSLKKFSNVNFIMEIWNDKTNKSETIKLMNNLWYHENQIDDSNWLFSK